MIDWIMNALAWLMSLTAKAEVFTRRVHIINRVYEEHGVLIEECDVERVLPRDLVLTVHRRKDFGGFSADLLASNIAAYVREKKP